MYSDFFSYLIWYIVLFYLHRVLRYFSENRGKFFKEATVKQYSKHQESPHRHFPSERTTRIATTRITVDSCHVYVKKRKRHVAAARLYPWTNFHVKIAKEMEKQK